jgi:hypothetical protein
VIGLVCKSNLSIGLWKVEAIFSSMEISNDMAIQKYIFSQEKNFSLNEKLVCICLYLPD